MPRPDALAKFATVTTKSMWTQNVTSLNTNVRAAI